MNDTYHCKRCNNTVKNCNRDTHEFYCAYSLKKDELNDLIPCEICNNLIQFSNYESHTNACSRFGYSVNQEIIRPIHIGFIGNPPNPNNEEDTSNSNTEENNPLMNSENILGLLINVINRSRNTTQQEMNVINDVNMETGNEEMVNEIENGNTSSYSPNFPPPPPPSIALPTSLTPSLLSPPILPSPLSSPSTSTSSITPTMPNLSQDQLITPIITNRPITRRRRRLNFTSPILTSTTNNQSTQVSVENMDDNNDINVNTFITNTIDNVVQNAINHIYYPNPAYIPPNTNYEALIELSNTIGVVEKGITHINKVAPKETTRIEINCPICMDNTYDIRKTICGHSYCSNCIEKWLKTNIKCPVCMTTLDDFDTNITEEHDDEDIYADE